MKRNVFRKLMKMVRKIEESWGSLENFARFTTFGTEQHKMKIGTEKHTMKIRDEFLFDESLEKVYRNLDDLTIADLCDFQNLSEEYGEFG